MLGHTDETFGDRAASAERSAARRRRAARRGRRQRGIRTDHPPEQLDRVVIRFAGDSGDGMQLTGDRFTTSSALLGNDLATFPDFPAEIRAPAGTLAGVSAFQVHISDHDILTPGDAPNVLVAMNPAALRANLGVLPKGATLIVNVDAFDERSLAKAGYDGQPARPTARLGAYTVYEVPMTSITQEVCKEAGVKPRDAERSKNFFALGLVSWLYTRPIEPTLEWIAQRFADRPQVAEANTRAFRAGFDFGETAELFESNYEVRPADLRAGRVRPGHRQPGPGLGADRRRPAGRAARCSSAATRSPRPRTSSTSCRGARSSASAPSRPRTRSPASARPSARPSAARSGSPPPAAPASTSSPRPSAWPSTSSCRCSWSTSSGAAPPPACRPRPSRPTCSTPCTAATARPRCRSWPPGRRRTASRRPSRRCGWPSSTAPR